ncbi:MAG: hypothetical protein SNF33_02235 [Candidatus Algichlamydia australiensis]|nr:hypothetical protein [Chlamydiales bacterium]
MLVWYTCTHLGGSLTDLFRMMVNDGVHTTVCNIWLPHFFGSPMAWRLIAIFMASQLLFMRIIPGKKFLGPITPKGNIPIYKENGVACFLLTLGLFSLFSFGLNLFSASIIFDHFGDILGAMTLFSLIFCLLLYFKGLYAPSSSDNGSSGNPIMDYYWGTELYPRILGWDVKMFTNCRFGMMSWGLILVSYAAKQHELYGISDAMIVAVSLQLLYIGKFFFWEGGYLRSLDIMHDRAGFYICWGCLVWVPCIYTSPTLYLVHHPNHLGPLFASLIFGLGVISILTNYMADRQRMRVRNSNGKSNVFGKKPVLICAKYKATTGEQKDSLLLASGFWGISRHFHYVPEILGAFFWSAPALFTGFLPYFYLVFLIILLTDRAMRDDQRCHAKYGKYWDRYCEKVPYKIIPFIF